jgi:hypothetical protein
MTREDRLTPEEIAAIRERVEDATVWSASYDCIAQTAVIHCNFEHYHMIARACTDIPRLLDALEAAYERERKLIDALRQLKSDFAQRSEESWRKWKRAADMYEQGAVAAYDYSAVLIGEVLNEMGYGESDEE